MSENVGPSSYEEYMFPDSNVVCKSEPCEESEESEIAVNNLILPDKSKAAYEVSYDRFLTWQKEHHTTSFSQSVLVTYFSDLSKKWKSSTLWSEYSKVGKMLKIKQNINVGEYYELKALLKKMSVGYSAKKSRALTATDLEQYLDKAPDFTCLETKVAMIFGILGACRKDELIKMETKHLRTYFESGDMRKKHPMLLVRLPDRKTHQEREFTIKGKFYEFYQRYSDLRPHGTPHDRFFLNYHNGKCTIRPIGEKKFASMPKQVAKFLKLPNSESYTGHAFCRTSATLVVDSGSDTTTLQQTSVAGGYGEALLLSKGINDQITNSIQLIPSPNNLPHQIQNIVNLPSTSLDSVTAKKPFTLNISNSSNCTFNITFNILEKK